MCLINTTATDDCKLVFNMINYKNSTYTKMFLNKKDSGIKNMFYRSDN